MRFLFFQVRFCETLTLSAAKYIRSLVDPPFSIIFGGLRMAFRCALLVNLEPRGIVLYTLQLQ